MPARKLKYNRTPAKLKLPRLLRIKQLPANRAIACKAVRTVDYGVLFIAKGTLYVPSVMQSRLEQQIPYFIKQVRAQLITLGCFTKIQYDLWYARCTAIWRQERVADAIHRSLYHIQQAGLPITAKVRRQVRLHHKRKFARKEADGIH